MESDLQNESSYKWKTIKKDLILRENLWKIMVWHFLINNFKGQSQKMSKILVDSFHFCACTSLSVNKPFTSSLLKTKSDSFDTSWTEKFTTPKRPFICLSLNCSPLQRCELLLRKNVLFDEANFSIHDVLKDFFFKILDLLKWMIQEWRSTCLLM